MNTIIATFMFAVLFWVIYDAVALHHLRRGLAKLTKRFEDHGHNTSSLGGTANEPINQKGVSFEQLLAAIGSLHNQDALDVQAMRRVLERATNTKTVRNSSQYDDPVKSLDETHVV